MRTVREAGPYGNCKGCGGWNWMVGGVKTVALRGGVIKLKREGQDPPLQVSGRVYGP